VRRVARGQTIAPAHPYDWFPQSANREIGTPAPAHGIRTPALRVPLLDSGVGAAAGLRAIVTPFGLVRPGTS
jgi:hypothetical protein